MFGGFVCDSCDRRIGGLDNVGSHEDTWERHYTKGLNYIQIHRRLFFCRACTAAILRSEKQQAEWENSWGALTCLVQCFRCRKPRILKDINLYVPPPIVQESGGESESQSESDDEDGDEDDDEDEDDDTQDLPKLEPSDEPPSYQKAVELLKRRAK